MKKLKEPNLNGETTDRKLCDSWAKVPVRHTLRISASDNDRFEKHYSRIRQKNKCLSKAAAIRDIFRTGLAEVEKIRYETP